MQHWIYIAPDTEAIKIPNGILVRYVKYGLDFNTPQGVALTFIPMSDEDATKFLNNPGMY